jgi:hypothetical protein
MNQEEVASKGGAWKIDQDTVAFVFSLHQWGNRKVANKDEIKSSADKAMLSVTKRLIESKEFKAVSKYMLETKAWVISKSVPSFFRDSCFLFRLSKVQEVEDELAGRRLVLRSLIEKLAEVYPTQIDEAEEMLGPDQFNRADYPSAETLKTLFYWESQWVSFRVPEDLPEMVRRAELEKAENMWRSAAENITFALRESFRELVSHAAGKLGTYDGTRKGTFRDSTIDNITEFLNTFRDRNITSDRELEILVKKAQLVMTDVEDAQVLRDNKELRAEVKRGFESITKELDALVEERPSRKFYLDEE